MSPDIACLLRRIERMRIGGDARPAGDRAEGDEALARRLGAVVLGPGLLLLEQSLPLSMAHGNLSFSAAERHFSRLPLPHSAGVAETDWLFLDTETTGLAGGGGTLAFLVGIARVRDGCLRIRQYLITRFAAEAAMLARVAAAIEGGEILVTYNGKCFDLPLLASRFRLQGLSSPFPNMPHLDLLHPVRRWFRGRWPNCRLVTAEQRLLGYERDDDMPGAAAPKAWFDYVRHHRWRGLHGILRHNRLDLKSLAVLLPAMDLAMAQPPHGATGAVDLSLRIGRGAGRTRSRAQDLR
jgi:uncharacterized protein YprB with RNaseH-like and TPR domain